MAYTQDESYYMLDAAEEACVYLGLKENIDRQQVTDDLHRAYEGEILFDADKYVNRWPAKKHDHFLIPAGTAHCSGRNSMVLEISATPYIFTFKMWDWGRLGWTECRGPFISNTACATFSGTATTAWVKRNLLNRVTEVARG